MGVAYHCWPIDLAPGVSLHECEHQCDDEGSTVAHGMVPPLKRLELFRVVLLEQRHVDIDSHCQVPQRIGRDKHLDQKTLELAQMRRLACSDARFGYHRSDVTEGISPRSVKYETVDGFPELGRGCKGHEDENGANERET